MTEEINKMFAAEMKKMNKTFATKNGKVTKHA